MCSKFKILWRIYLEFLKRIEPSLDKILFSSWKTPKSELKFDKADSEMTKDFIELFATGML